MDMQAYCRRFSEKVEVEKSSLESMLHLLKDMEKNHAELVSEFISFDRQAKSNFAELRGLIHSEIVFNGENPLELESKHV